MSTMFNRVFFVFIVMIYILSLPVSARAAIELISKMKTKAGELKISMNDDTHEHTITLKGKIIYKNVEPSKMSVYRVFNYSKSDLILLNSHAGNSQIWYYFLTLNENGTHLIEVQEVPQAKGNIETKGEKVVFTFSNNELWVYENGKINKSQNKSNYIGDYNCKELYDTYINECNSDYVNFASFCMASRRFISGISDQFYMPKYHEICKEKGKYEFFENNLKSNNPQAVAYAKNYFNTNKKKLIEFDTFKTDICTLNNFSSLINDLLRGNNYKYEAEFEDEYQLNKESDSEYTLYFGTPEGGDFLTHGYALKKSGSKWTATKLR